MARYISPDAAVTFAIAVRDTHCPMTVPSIENVPVVPTGISILVRDTILPESVPVELLVYINPFGNVTETITEVPLLVPVL